MARVPIDQVREALHARAAALGFADARAARLADHFLDAELRGASGHGVERMRWLHGLGGLQPEAAAVETDRSEGYVRYDGGGALGYLALAEVLERELAEPPAGARLVVVADCFPTGRLGYFAEMGSRAGLVTLLSATSTPRIVHPEGGPPVTGTNPICLAVPGDPPTLVDVSMGVVTYGAVLKAADYCAAEPEKAARRLVAAGSRYEYALQTLTEIQYRNWRQYDPEDTLRFYALLLHEAGMVKSTPREIIADKTDWRFLNELKRELKT